LHAKASHWHDAEAAVAVTENAIALSTTAVIRHIRGVPDHCPDCGSQRLSPDRGYRLDLPDVEWERPTCDKCGWTGTPVQIAAARNSSRQSAAPSTRWRLHHSERPPSATQTSEQGLTAPPVLVKGQVPKRDNL
jgi:predicted RNA-binding Zn-ribbon protein involved in translation (DUF1610 family)